MSMIGLNLLLYMTSRAESAALSTIRPNLFVNFSAPNQKVLKVSVKHTAETGMVQQRHHSLALLHNYNNNNNHPDRLALNSNEDSAAEVTDSNSDENSQVSKEKLNFDNNSRDLLLAEYSNGGRIDEISPEVNHQRNDKINKPLEDHDQKSDENLNLWITSSLEKSKDDSIEMSTSSMEKNPTLPVEKNKVNVPLNHHSNDFTDYTGNDSENVAETDDDHNRYFVKVKTKPRDAFIGLGFSSFPISQSIEPQFLITAPETQLPLSINLNHESQIQSSETLKHIISEDKLGNVPNFININSRDTELINNSADKELFPTPPPPTTTTTSATDLISSVTQKFGMTKSASIPGMAGIDYPILGEVPITGFDCQKQRYKGFFADIDTKCQAWHYCDFTDGHSTFLCPNGTLFSQVLLTCDWWFNVDCRQAQQLYVLNERLYRYIKAPKPSFPEDYHGPQVDHWLIEQLNLGLLPKMKKFVKDKTVIQGIN